jgi:hypothetical protein
MTSQFNSAAEYAGFLGQLDGISNLIALFILLVGFSRYQSLGCGNTCLLFPAVLC